MELGYGKMNGQFNIVKCKKNAAKCELEGMRQISKMIYSFSDNHSEHVRGNPEAQTLVVRSVLAKGKCLLRLSALFKPTKSRGYQQGVADNAKHRTDSSVIFLLIGLLFSFDLHYVKVLFLFLSHITNEIKSRKEKISQKRTAWQYGAVRFFQ
jgi:hypothetical protein